MQRLLKRRKVQECLEETEKEIGDTGMSLNDLESLLNEEGIDTKIETLATRRIASNSSTRYLLINDVKQKLVDAKKKNEAINPASTSKDEETTNTEGKESKKGELEDDLEKAIKMSLECTNEADTTAGTSKTDDSWTSCMSDSETEFSKTDSEEEDGCEAPDMTSAKAYIMQYCDFTNKAIDDIVSSRLKSAKSKNKKSEADDILDEINFKKSQRVANCDHLSSSDDEFDNSIDLDVHTTVEQVTSAKSVNNELNDASVVVLENPNSEVIMLDSTIDESPEKSIDSKNNDEYQEQSSDNGFEDIRQTKQAVVTPTSFVYKENVENEKKSSNNDFEDVPQIEHAVATTLQSSDKNEESGSSDDDFEEVPEISKPVVQLSLDMNEAPEDDIFADIFTENQAKVDIQNENTTPKITKNKRITSEDYEQNDDELQKAIMMSLECVMEDNITMPDEIDYNEKEILVQDTHKELKTDVTSKETLKISKTQESLNEILSAQPSIAKTIIDESKQMITKDKAPITTEQLNNMVEEIQNEEQNLEQEKGRLDRIGRNITEQMTKEAQELLQIFGIPYIVAPMEAEAQCAFLESVNLTDGTITDDSDIWLFGGRTVYKNFFNQKKHVLQFLGERIEKSFSTYLEILLI